MISRLTFLALAVALVAAACSKSEGSDKKGGWGGGMNVTQAVTVEVVTPEQGEFTVRGDYPGEFLSDAMADLSSEVGGRVHGVNVRLGDRVEEGQELAKVNPVTYRQRVNELRASVDLAQASVEEAKITKQNLEAELARKKPLLARKLITEREIEDLEARITAAEQNLQVARATVSQNRARLASARDSLSDTTVRAPFGGVVAERYVDAGSYVNPGQPMFRLVDDTAIYLRLRLPENESGLIQQGMTVTLRVDALGGQKLTGKVGRVAPAVDPTTRTLRIDVFPENREDWAQVKPGMYARAQIVLGERESALTVSNQVILKDRDGSRYVWIIRDGKAEKQAISTGLQGRERTEVVEGLGADDQVVLRGIEKLRPGAEVSLINQNPAPAADGTSP